CCNTNPAPCPCPTKLDVNASIFLSNSATRLSVFFCLFRDGAVTTHCRPVFAQRVQPRPPPGPVLGSGSQRTFSWRQASHARGRLASSGSWSSTWWGIEAEAGVFIPPYTVPRDPDPWL